MLALVCRAATGRKPAWPFVIATLRDGLACPRLQFLEHLIALAERDDVAFLQKEDFVRDRQRGRPVSHQDQSDAGTLEVFYRFNECGLSRLVEIGVGLVEDNESRIAKSGTGQSDSLALTTRQPHAAIADVCVIALREMLDHLVG